MARRKMSRVISYDGLSPRFYDSVDAWMAHHEEVIQYISFHSPDSPTSSPDPFPVRRELVHERTLVDLQSFQASLDRLGDSLQQQITQFSRRQPQLTFPVLEMNARKCLFLRASIIRTQERVVSRKLFALMTRQNAVRSLISLIQSDLIPEDRYCCLSSSFLTMDFKVDEKTLKIRSKIAKFEFLRSFHAQMKVPVWITDFGGFFTDAIRKCEETIDDDHSVYVKHIETDLSIPIRSAFSAQLKDLDCTSNHNLPTAILGLCSRSRFWSAFAWLTRRSAVRSFRVIPTIW
jgi:hypothetical protein